MVLGHGLCGVQVAICCGGLCSGLMRFAVVAFAVGEYRLCFALTANVRAFMDYLQARMGSA